MSTLVIQKGNSKIEFGVSWLPNRKNAALIKTRGAMLEPLAYFRNDECAKEFEKILEILFEVGGGQTN